MKNLIKSTRTFLALTLLSSVTIGLNSCNDDILELTPLDRISETAVFTDEVFLTNYVNGNYRGIRQQFNPDAGGYEGLTDIATFQDQTIQYGSSAVSYREGNLSPDVVENFTRVIDNNGSTHLWKNSYEYIRRINVFFENTEGSTELNEDRLRVLTGESAFQRAYIYFELLRHFGGVPLLTTSVALEESESTPVTRSTYDQVAQFVLDELDRSAQLLAGEDMQTGRASQGAALALKARLLMYMASPLNNPSNDISKWQAAEAAHEAVFALGYSLHPDHEAIQRKPIKTDEVIFGREYTIQNGTESVAFGIAWGYNYDFWPAGFDAQQKQVPTQRFVNMHQMTNGEYPYLDENFTLNPASGHDPQDPFVNRDPRFYFNILYPDAPVNLVDGGRSTQRTYEYWEDANPNIPNENPTEVDPINGQVLYDFGRDSRSYWVEGRTPFHWNVQTGYIFNKLLDFDGPRADTQYEYNNVSTFIRLAEMYLNYAEIQIALGNEDGARTYINMVRSRPSVNMPPITASGAELVKVYRNERAVELALEDHRFWDLLRWKAGPGNIDINPVNGLKSVTKDWSDGGKLSFEYGPIVEQREPWPGDYYYLLPIPRDEINRTGIEQNPGYQ
ncbi:RagB/SusD family nutrient uptake outer membrane protein [Arenibacter troitsensis]|uniref:Starch-binding associating with outer membrane n=1 Tax=Arenibacter troitsensis TaxID=188872 RepID=A0A1X7KJH0_9FLAO|nr:RagB/SusD family nutrient uptake outer membrane protein [Arenibacter troitsensis]SMG41208.1 Starch-binding associating with outer membrane [Arenibacter troitsensis]